MLRQCAIAVVALLVALPLAARAQDNAAAPQQNPPSAPTPKDQPKKDQQKKSTADQNPFPEAQSEQAAHQAQQGDATPSAPQPQTTPQRGEQSKPSTAGENPFPEAQSEKAAHQAQPEPSAPAPASTSAGDSYSSSQVKGLDLPDAEGAPASAAAAPMLYNPKLARKDAQIGDFYLESGNYKGAYDRFLEASRSDPGNAEAVFGLADSARHLNLRDEALRNYRLYLSALPNGPHAKEIRKALREMGAAPAS